MLSAEINSNLVRYLSKNKFSVVFGQNLISGSRISGLGKNLDKIKDVYAFNSTNTENSLMGLGFGLAIQGMNSFYVMKQHDFALLGLDQLTNTNKLTKALKVKGTFTILMVVVDSGYEGPQSNLYNLNEFSSLINSPIYLLNCSKSIEKAFASTESPLRIFAVSQKYLKAELEENNRTQVGNSGFLKEGSSTDPHTSVALVNFGLISENYYKTKSYLIDRKFNPTSYIQWRIDSSFEAHALDYLLSIDQDKIIIFDDCKSKTRHSSFFGELAKLKNKQVLMFNHRDDIDFLKISVDLPKLDYNLIDSMISS